MWMCLVTEIHTQNMGLYFTSHVQIRKVCLSTFVCTYLIDRTGNPSRAKKKVVKMAVISSSHNTYL